MLARTQRARKGSHDGTPLALAPRRVLAAAGDDACGTSRCNDFIYLSEGNSNAYLVVTPAGRVVINTGMGFEAPVHKAYFDSDRPRPASATSC